MSISLNEPFLFVQTFENDKKGDEEDIPDNEGKGIVTCGSFGPVQAFRVPAELNYK